MKSDLRIKARDLCYAVAALLILELMIALIIFGDAVAGLAAMAMAAFAFVSGKRLAVPSELLDARQALVSSLPALCVLLVGIIILSYKISGWAMWLCVAIGYMIGNRTRAAGLKSVNS